MLDSFTYFDVFFIFFSGCFAVGIITLIFYRIKYREKRRYEESLFGSDKKNIINDVEEEED